jgi:hypothetical protein
VIIDGAAGGETKRRHDVTFPLLTLHRGKDRVHFHFSSVDVAPRKRSCTFFYRIFPKTKHCLCRRPGEFS